MKLRNYTGALKDSKMPLSFEKKTLSGIEIITVLIK